MRSSRDSYRLAGSSLVVLAVAACVGSAAAAVHDRAPAERAAAGGVPTAVVALDTGAAMREQVLRGRMLTIHHGCGGCHGGGGNPADSNWLAGQKTVADEFLIGACATKPGAKPCFHTRPRNLTPDNVTGLGRFSERQIFNALRFGLRPGETADAEITSTVPGQGNFPAEPKYLAPPMPWTEWRFMSDQELMDIAAYLKHGVKPVHNRVPDSEGPPDFWASGYTVARIGPYPAPAFPTAREREP